MRYLLILLFLQGLLNAKIDPEWQFYGILEPEEGFPKAYYQIQDMQQKKKFFMDTINPLILESHKRIYAERAFIKHYFKMKKAGTVSQKDQKKFEKISKKYRIKNSSSEITYLRRIDIVPTALVLAQSAAESAWGGSRFAKEANNLFGEWTWGFRGIIPEGRPKGKKYKIRIFNSLQDSVDSYMLNLNRHYAYENFRKARFEKHSTGVTFIGKEATNYLESYSTIGESYQEMLEGIINYNNMCDYSLLNDTLKRPH